MRRRHLVFVIPALILSLAALAACGDDGSDGSGSGDSIEVVAAFYPLAEVAEQVGGDRVDVSDLTPPGAEPHDLELTTDDVDAIEDADLVVVLGEGFQPALEDATDGRDGQTLTVLDTVSVRPGEEEAIDPHVWLDPVRMGEIVDAVTAALVDLDPDGRDDYEANAAAYAESIAALDAEYAAGLAGCEGALLVTAHDAFGYLADRYGLEVEGVAGISPEAEPNPDRLADLADLVSDEGVTTIFTETLVSSDVAETLAREAGGLRTAVLNPLEGLTDDELADGADYVSVMRDNLAALEAGLACGG